MESKCFFCGNAHEDRVCSACLPTADRKLRKLIDQVNELENLINERRKNYDYQRNY
jgi:hypothetical protein